MATYFKGGRIHQFWDARSGDYASHSEFAIGEPIASRTLPGVTIFTHDLDGAE